MARIAVGGFLHETNTFAPDPATYREFEKHDGWPGLVRGAGLFDALAGCNLGAAGFVQAARAAGHDLVPLTWCSAEPSAHVTEDAFERITGFLCDDLAAMGPFDAVYLDLHGAMVTERYEDGEGEVLGRVRQVIGAQLPLVASLDFHANLTEAMTELATALTIYRTYPHIDLDTTGVRAHELLLRALAGETLVGAFRKLPFLIPLSAQCTLDEPNRALYRRVVELSGDRVASLDFAEGFPPADILECGPAVVAYDPDPGAAAAAADAMAEAVLAAETEFVNPLILPAEAVARAVANGTGKPVVLADAQDNPGAGGSSDTVGLLRALVEGGAKGAVFGILNDPEIAARAHAAGLGARFSGALGGKSGQAGDSPFAGEFRVEALGDGRFTCTGEMFRGTHTALGAMALLTVIDAASEVRVIVGCNRFQCLDQAIFRHLGVEPAEARIVALKSTVHFRADFDAIAEETLIVEAPGAHPCRLTGLDYRRLRAGVRLEPGGPAFQVRRAG